jgi:hypothetical protein
MDYTSKTVRSRPGLTDKEALASLYKSPYAVAGMRIASFTQQADRWVAELELPRTAGGFPPSDDSEGGGDESAPKPPKEDGPPSDDSEDSGSDSSSDSPDGGDDSGSKPPSKGDKPGSDAQVVQLLTQILHTLGGGAPMGGPGGPDDLGPGAGGPPAPPPHGGPPHGGPGGPGAGGLGASRPIKPGEVPNKPGVVPIGSPAFSSVQHQAMGGPLAPGPNPVDPAAAGLPGTTPPGPISQGGTGQCAGCNGPIGPDGSCPTCGGAYTASLKREISKVAGRTASMTITSPDPTMGINETVRVVKSVAEPLGYKVKQAKRVASGHVAVLLSVR